MSTGIVRGDRPARKLARSVWKSFLEIRGSGVLDVHRRVPLFCVPTLPGPWTAPLDFSVADMGCYVLEHNTILWVACKHLAAWATSASTTELERRSGGTLSGARVGLGALEEPSGCSRRGLRLAQTFGWSPAVL